ncbi:MAG: carboxypeptidase regulatory-like domain-containing protein [Deltaproteobacteria bacterium]|nr:carboxypeptidase regulatory-like domain-containing protein [Deltaproteobacteria bacterium]
MVLVVRVSHPRNQLAGGVAAVSAPGCAVWRRFAAGNEVKLTVPKGETVELTVVAGGRLPRTLTVRAPVETPVVEVRLSRGLGVSGRVVDASSNSPLADAVVVPSTWAHQPHLEALGSVRTSRNGEFKLPTMPEAEQLVRVSANGFIPRLALVDSETEEIRVMRGEVEPGQVQTVGIGIVFSAGREGARVESVWHGAPASGQVQKGDLITDLNGVSLRGLTQDQVFSLFLGEPDSSVELRVLRSGQFLRRRLQRTLLVTGLE